jgi:hypothetical protein
MGQAVHDALPGSQPQSVDGRIRHGDHGNGAVDFVFSGHGAVVPWKVEKERSCVFIVETSIAFDSVNLSRAGQGVATAAATQAKKEAL